MKTQTVTLKRLVAVQPGLGMKGSVLAKAEGNTVVLEVFVTQIPKGGGKISLSLDWGKVWGEIKKHREKGEKENAGQKV